MKKPSQKRRRAVPDFDRDAQLRAETKQHLRKVLREQREIGRLLRAVVRGAERMYASTDRMVAWFVERRDDGAPRPARETP